MKIFYFKEGKKNMSKKKKIFILVSMVLLLVITGGLNVFLAKQNTVENSSSSAVVSGNFFVTYRADRTETRNLEIAYLDEIINSATASAEHKETATQKKMEIVANMEKELIVENLIKAKGYEDAVVTMASDSINVIVKGKEALTSTEVAQILSVVTTETGCKATSVKVVPIQ